MKKGLIKAILFLSLGFMIGETIFGDMNSYLKKWKNMDTYYFLQEGVYTNPNELQTNIKNINEKMILKEKNAYYVYVGITKDKEIAKTIQDIYEREGYKIYYKEKNVSSREFSENVNQFDLLIRDTEEEDQILTIEKVVLANYEEIVKKR